VAAKADAAEIVTAAIAMEGRGNQRGDDVYR
jgi:hypothetical protein